MHQLIKTISVITVKTGKFISGSFKIKLIIIFLHGIVIIIKKLWIYIGH
jgi:hypothetical protein